MAKTVTALTVADIREVVGGRVENERLKTAHGSLRVIRRVLAHAVAKRATADQRSRSVRRE